MSRIGGDVTLEQINSWFGIGKQVRVQTVPRSKLGGRQLDPVTGQGVLPGDIEKPFIPPYKRHAKVDNPNQSAYAKYYQDEENAKLFNSVVGPLPLSYLPDSTNLSTVGSVSDRMESLETDSIMTGLTSTTLLPDGMTEEESVAVYKNYDFEHTFDGNLPITKYMEEIVDTVESNQTTVIVGDTGSGKTTQVPQYILDRYAQENRYCNVVVTQPRRIAAMSISRRVCHERQWTLGGICGFQVGMERKASDDTRLLYCTTGVLLEKLIAKKSMSPYTHVILDEVHERDLESDFCLLVVRKLLRTVSRDVKVILMSATFDTPLFANYFSLPLLGKLEPAPVFTVTGHCYEVTEFYVEDLEALGPLPYLQPERPGITSESFALAAKLIAYFDKVETDQYGADENGLSKKRGSVLVFLPGLAEIQDLEEKLRMIQGSKRLWILPLHSSITAEEQVKVFDKPKLDMRKVILSTNIAESSITVSDIKYVIDFCLTKNLVCEAESNLPSLQVQWASMANCTQRKGRAGRVSCGRVYRMVTRLFFETTIPEYGIPEMQRCPLEHPVLKAKVLNMGEPKAILGLALSPPNLDDIERTILTLREVGALSSSQAGGNPHDGELTFLGQVLAKLPVDVHYGKLIMLGHVFGLLEEAIIMAASLTCNSFFSRPFKAYLESYRHKLGWAESSFSDCVAYLNAFQTWEYYSINSLFGPGDEIQWCRKNFIQLRRIREVKEQVEDLKRRLFDFSIRVPRRRDNQQDRNRQRRDVTSQTEDDKLLLKLVMCGAFYPHYFIRDHTDEEQAIRSLSGKNPFTTVLVKGLPQNQGVLYRKYLEDIFAICDPANKPAIHFEETRAYIEFRKDHTSKQTANRILPAVYVSLKMRELRIALEVPLFHTNSVREKLENLSLEQDTRAGAANRLRTNRIVALPESADAMDSIPIPRQVALPSPQETIIAVYVTYINDCGHFWAHKGDDTTWQDLNDLQLKIRMKDENKSLRHMVPGDIRVGNFCLAPYGDHGCVEYYRAYIQKLEANQVKVFFVDYGNGETVLGRELKMLPRELLELPFQAFECELCRIMPSPVKCPNGRWTIEAQETFKSLVENKYNLKARVFSIVDGVVRVDLYETLPNKSEIHINEQLVKRFFADTAEENFVSKQNHEEREEQDFPKTRPVMQGHKGIDWSAVCGQEAVDPEKIGVAKKGARLKLSGPNNPYEMNFHSVTCSGRSLPTRIERDSVNSVALDDEPHDKHARMMVAAKMGLNPSGTVIMARDTTIMPNIHGLPALLMLLFTPSAELRTDPDRTRYTGALCGLGWERLSGGPALPENDVEIAFDTLFDVEDISSINHVRIAINIAIGSESQVGDFGPDAVVKIQRKARSKILELVKKRRASVEPYFFTHPHKWNQVAEEYVLRPCLDDQGTEHALLNLHCLVALQDSMSCTNPETEYDRRERVLEEKRKHTAWLHEKAGRSTEKEEIICKLCNNTLLRTPRELCMHLATRSHRQQEALLV